MFGWMFAPPALESSTSPEQRFAIVMARLDEIEASVRALTLAVRKELDLDLASDSGGEGSGGEGSGGEDSGGEEEENGADEHGTAETSAGTAETSGTAGTAETAETTRTPGTGGGEEWEGRWPDGWNGQPETADV